MATYAIGDLQGCFRSLQALLEEVGYSEERDTLWFVGDLVNRGPRSLACLKWVYEHRDKARVVLGNHDLHLLARALAGAPTKSKDTLQVVFAAPDKDKIFKWLASQPLVYVEDDYVLTHAGLYPGWTAEKAEALSKEFSRVVRSIETDSFLARMYGGEPCQWADGLEGDDRLRFIVNACTRMRMVRPGNILDFEWKKGPEGAPESLTPWYDVPAAETRRTVLFGHWSALGLLERKQQIGLDTGCVWGGHLTAVRLEDRKVFQVPSQDGSVPLDE